MDELTLLCTQELVKDLMNTASSSDENEETNQKIDALTFLCAQHLMDDLMDTSSTSDDDDEVFTILSYINMMKKSETPSRRRDNERSNHERNPKDEDINSFLKSGERHIRKDNSIATVLKKSTNKAKETHLKNGIPNLSAERCHKSSQQDNYLLKETANEAIACDVFQRNKHKEKEPILSSYNLQYHLDEDIIDSFSENEFKQYFHINREILTYLIERFSTWYCKGSNEQNGQESNIKTIMLTFLWFCANPVSFESVTRIFNASLIDSIESLNIILDFFESILALEIIKLPTSYIEKECVAKDFEKIDGFPNVLGCLAVSCLTLKTPELIEICGGPKLYLRGICDSKCRFLNINIALSKEPKSDKFLEKVLPKLCFPKYHLLGDATCLIRDNLVIPYENADNLSKSEEYFNTKLVRTHVKIKEAFSNLSNRFRQLHYLDFSNIENVSKFITACCILHNICMDRQDFYDETYTDGTYCQFVESSQASAQSDDFLNDLGLMKRYELTEILFRTKK